jgi:ketosteroid isomerase-like protein
MRKIGFSAIAILLAVPVFGHEPEKQEPANAVRVVLQRNAEAFERGDMRALDSIWAADDSVTVFEDGHANYGWTDYRENHLKPEMAEMKNVQYRLSDIKPRVDGKTAWATFKYTIEADVEGKRIAGGGLGTAILEKRRCDWKIVHWHSSAPRRKPAEAAPQTKQ